MTSSTSRTAEEQVARLLADRTGTAPQDWFLVVKARYGLQVVFSALGAVRGPGEVVTQVFTCATAVDPVLVSGLRPVYAEVSPESVAIDPEGLQPPPSAHAVMLQHTFGIVDEPRARRLRAVADAAGALLIEDAAHCAARLARSADGAPLADVSVHSFGVEKVLPTRFGGAVWVNPALGAPAVRERIVSELGALPVVGGRLAALARVNRTTVRALNRLPAGAASRVRSALTRVGAFEPPIAEVERRGGLAAAPTRPSAWMTAQVAAALPALGANEARRSAAVGAYLATLAGRVQVPAAIGPDSSLLRFPFFAPDADAAERVFAALTASGARPGRWYRPALFPGPVDPQVYGYRPGDGSLRVTEDLVARVVNLPTDVTPERARATAADVLSALG